MIYVKPKSFIIEHVYHIGKMVIKTLFKSKSDHIDSNFDWNSKFLQHLKDFLYRIFINNFICYCSCLGATNHQSSYNLYTANFVKTNTSRARKARFHQNLVLFQKTYKCKTMDLEKS